jgi:chorismate dehydratase
MAARETIRVGVVPFLNVQPLIAHLSSQVDGVEILAETPSRLVPLLASKTVDVAIVPAFSLLDHPEWAIVPGAALVSDGPVQSVAVFSASPRGEIRRVFLDPASMTSNALVQVLFRHHWSQEVEFIRRSKMHVQSEPGTAHLIIGDAALRLRRQFPTVLDLGEAWKAWCGLPFVYAVWAVRPGVDLGPLAARLGQAPELHGEELFHQIAGEHAREVGISVDEAFHYLRDNMRYRLGREEMLGLRQYLNACQALGLGPCEPVRLRILQRSDDRSEML